MFYAFREALRVVADETLPVSWRRHSDMAQQLWAGLDAMGLRCLVPIEDRLPTLTTVCVPEGVAAGAVIARLKEKFNIEIGGGLGQLAGKASDVAYCMLCCRVADKGGSGWLFGAPRRCCAQILRIGLMGFNSRPENVHLLLSALRSVLAEVSAPPSAL
jgi:alanine-glyoxylate transaminase/serine-glyoxylate transaminase/serine-pyruvate transaminase